MNTRNGDINMLYDCIGGGLVRAFVVFCCELLLFSHVIDLPPVPPWKKRGTLFFCCELLWLLFFTDSVWLLGISLGYGGLLIFFTFLFVCPKRKVTKEKRHFCFKRSTKTKEAMLLFSVICCFLLWIIVVFSCYDLPSVPPWKKGGGLYSFCCDLLWTVVLKCPFWVADPTWNWGTRYMA